MKSALRTAIFAHALLRIASSASGIVAGIWLASLAGIGLPFRASLVGALSASSFGAELVAAVPLGVASDALSVRLLVTAGALLGALATSLFGLSVRVPMFFTSRVLEGIAVAAVTPPLLRYLASTTADDAQCRARSMSLFELSLLAGLALGGVVGAQLWAHAHRFSFGLLALVYVIVAILLGLAIPRRPGAGGRAAWRGLKQAVADPFVRELAPVWLCVNAIIGLWLGPTLSFVLTESAASTQYLDGVFAATPTRLGWLLLGYTLVFGLGVFIWSRLLPIVGARRTMGIALLAMLGVSALLMLLNHSGGWSALARGLLGVATAILVMIESGFGPAALSWLAQALGRQAGIGAAMGVYSLLLSLGALGGSLLAGWSATHWRIDGLVGATAVLAVGALLLLGRMRPLHDIAMER